MTTNNPMKINFAAINEAADKRIKNLESISGLIGTQAGQMVSNLADVKETIEMLDLRWEALDAEGRALVPADVRKVFSYFKTNLGTLETTLSNPDVGLRNLLPYAEKAGQRPVNPATEYTIRAAIPSIWTTDELADAIGELYSEGSPAGGFNVEGTDTSDWKWITFNRYLDQDRDLISNLIAKSNFTIDGKAAAIEQLIAEFQESAPYDELADTICKALIQAEVRFPAPTLAV